ncbi:sugar ABC transporter substrate-binding protein [Rhodoligotrophos defluvii]|uniref:sugar ABC transporter substrate-binding protein n=1 Tax=Rhodoligotrophos defluvii TaxID=2561934 RepID=UPI0010C94587|nr:sugar ABC transporter substrate-binding protein [Rhodoligotrophos defluvii]
MRFCNAVCAVGAITAGCLGLVTSPQAEGLEDPSRAAYLEAFKGKTVAFVPVSMGIDLTQAWSAQMEKQAKDLGYEYIVRDPNWSTDAGAQVLTQLIAEKPDIIVVHNPDVQSYARLLKQAEAQGIYVLQVNMKSAYMTEGYVGADWNGLGEAQAKLVAEHCGKGSGKSGKVSIVQGVLTSGASVYQIHGVMKVLAEHPEISVVSNQAADWDASKAKAITQTVLQQHPDLCAVIGFWDGMDTGVAAAVREAGKSDEVFVVTSAGGSQSACDNVANGNFSALVNYDAMGQGRDLNGMIKTLLQVKPDTGSMKVINYSPVRLLTKDTVGPGSCWTLQPR